MYVPAVSKKQFENFKLDFIFALRAVNLVWCRIYRGDASITVSLVTFALC